MRPSTSLKIAIAAAIAILFAGFILRAALRLAATAMHSMLLAIVLVALVVWLFARRP